MDETNPKEVAATVEVVLALVQKQFGLTREEAMERLEEYLSIAEEANKKK